MNYAYIFIGSNVDRDKNYIEALQRLRELGTIVRVSSVYETEPVGGPSDECFYNGAVLLATELGVRALKRELHRIEAEMGRRRTQDRNAPRTIDLDLVLFNREVRDEIQVPDPLILSRPFMALALAEVNPNYVHPSNGRTLAEIAAELGPRADGLRIEPGMTARIKALFGEIYSGEVLNA